MNTQFVLELARTPAAARTARHQLAGWLGFSHAAPDLNDAILLVSELVTNALVHGRGRIELRAQLDDDRLRVDVIDEGHGFARTDPCARGGRYGASGRGDAGGRHGDGERGDAGGRHSPGGHGDAGASHDDGGRGLEIVDAYASAWGVGDGTTDVWFELRRRRPPP
jgi:anti-sigma regulatory factor (Ser/Thr protein kinase)